MGLKGESAWMIGAKERRAKRAAPSPALPPMLDPQLTPGAHPERLKEAFPPPKKRRGRPPGTWTAPHPEANKRHIPSDDMRRTINNMASYGLDVMTISKLVDLAPATIYRHYGTEMKTAAAKKDLMVMQTGFLKAVGGPEQNWEKADPAMIRWWISVRQNWQLPAQRSISINANLDLSKLSDAQLDELERIMEQAAMEPGGYPAGEGGPLIEAEPRAE